MMKPLFTLAVCILLSGAAFSQATATNVGGAADPHFSMYNAAPLLLNPAMTGAFEGNYRVTAIYRSQWGSVLSNETVPMFSTPSASVDFRTNKGFSQGDAFGFGVFFMDDKAGESDFTTNIFGLSLAYHKSLDKRHEHFISLGFSSSIWQRSINYQGLQFPDQNNSGVFDPNLSNKENFVNNNLLFWDINWGLLYTGRFGRRSRASGYIGFSMDHDNRPNESFLGDLSVRLPIKYTAHGGYRFPLAGRFDMQPKVLFMKQGVSNELDLGTDIRIVFEEREREGNNFRFGANFRMVGGDPNAAWHDGILNAEAVILNAGVEFYHFSVSAAYDINVSQLEQGTNSQGGFELALAYTGAFGRRHPSTIFCPKF